MSTEAQPREREPVSSPASPPPAAAAHPPISPAEARAAVAEFRSWYRVLMRRNRKGPREHLWAAVLAAALPYRAAKNARRGVRRFGADVEATSGRPRWRQFADLWWLRMRHGVDNLAYTEYQLYRPDRRADAGLFLREREFFRVARALNRLQVEANATDAPVMGDKRRFVEWCAERGLPTAPVYAEWNNGELVYDGLAGGELPPRDLFSKPPDHTGGHGTARWVYDAQAGGYRGRDGRVRSADELRAELAHVSQTLPPKYRRVSRRIVLMPGLHNHPALAPLTTGALCTVRIVTYRAPGAPASVLLATYKMATGDAPADNFHFGGMLAPVDLATGRLGPGLRRQGQVLVPVTRHPDTGAEIAGHQLPDWEAALRLARRAHDAARGVTAFGWDMALTPDGPTLIEGNTASNPDIAQAPTGRPLGYTPLVAAYNAQLRALLAR